MYLTLVLDNVLSKNNPINNKDNNNHNKYNNRVVMYIIITKTNWILQELWLLNSTERTAKY